MYQQLIIIGNLGRDPEMKYTPNGKAVTEFPVAVNGRNNETAWYTVTCWERLAETTYQHLKKGRTVMVAASKIEADAWVDKASGEARSKLKITANDVRFLSGGERRADEGQSQHSGEDLPF